MRLLIAALAALWMMAPASAAQHPDDRYFDSRAPAAVSQKALTSKQIRRHVKGYRQHAKRASRATPRITTPEHKKPSLASGWGRTTIAAPHETKGSVEDKASAKTININSNWIPAVLGPRPHAWCGWFMGKLHGLLDRRLWRARNWATVGTPAAKQAGVIVVWKHHVGKITAVRADGAIKVLSGNDGHAVRDRWRSARGVIAYRAL